MNVIDAILIKKQIKSLKRYLEAVKLFGHINGTLTSICLILMVVVNLDFIVPTMIYFLNFAGAVVLHELTKAKIKKAKRNLKKSKWSEKWAV